jgi:Zn-dependent protease
VTTVPEVSPESPTPPGASAPDRPPASARWATAIGIVSVCYASLGILFWLLLLGLIVVGAHVARPAAEDLAEPALPATASYVFGGVSALCLGMSMLLLVGGILLAARRPGGRWAHLIWAGAALLLPILMGGFLAVDRAIPAPRQLQQGPFLAVAAVDLAVAAYPVFVLWWFLRRRIREQTRAWKHVRPADAPAAATAPLPALLEGAPPLTFTQGPGKAVAISRTGIHATLAGEALDVPWAAVARLDFWHAPFKQRLVGAAHVTDPDGKGFAWFDPSLSDSTLAKPTVQPEAAPAGPAEGPARPTPRADRVLALPGSVLLAAIVIEKAGLAEQPDGAFVRPPPAEETPAAAPPPAHAAPEEKVPGGESARRWKQAALLLAGFLAFSYMYSPMLAASLLAFLLVHEYGHAAAMKWCGVRVGGIFILPFMGAVAVARDEAATRWKEFLIAVMGSVFGAALTLPVAAAAMATGGTYPVLAQSAFWWSVLSLLNLLPLGMLDGGRILTSIAFSTHRLVGTLASALVVALCVAAALFLGSWLLGLVAVATVLQMRAGAIAQKRNLALVGIGCTPDALRRGVAATWQRIGLLCGEGDRAMGEKARRAVRQLDAFRRFFTGQFEMPRMSGGQIAAAVATYLALIVFFVLLLACASFALHGTNPLPQ